jgi:hypothetical protein
LGRGAVHDRRRVPEVDPGEPVERQSPAEDAHAASNDADSTGRRECDVHVRELVLATDRRCVEDEHPEAEQIHDVDVADVESPGTGLKTAGRERRENNPVVAEVAGADLAEREVGGCVPENRATGVPDEHVAHGERVRRGIRDRDAGACARRVAHDPVQAAAQGKTLDDAASALGVGDETHGSRVLVHGIRAGSYDLRPTRPPRAGSGEPYPLATDVQLFAEGARVDEDRAPVLDRVYGRLDRWKGPTGHDRVCAKPKEPSRI